MLVLDGQIGKNVVMAGKGILVGGALCLVINTGFAQIHAVGHDETSFQRKNAKTTQAAIIRIDSVRQTLRSLRSSSMQLVYAAISAAC